mmetsp:Transcript_38069/g.66056  ORF Transcript_38069/g.66056 Transcript_38069/m.66056 type:complete len:249 (-) Transcript_38069:416-1162(-)
MASSLQICNILFFLLSLGATFLDRRIGKSNAEVSDTYRTIVTPPGWAFAIWGVIFFLELLFCIWQLFIDDQNDLVFVEVGYWFVTACIFQTLWSFAFAKEYLATAAILLGAIAVCLFTLCMRISSETTRSLAEEILVHIAFGLHGGWTFVAALLNVNVVGVARNASPRFQLAVAVLTLCLVLTASALFTFEWKNVAYSLALAWAMFGVSKNQGQTEYLLGSGTASVLANVCLALAGFLVALGLVSIVY